MGTMIVDHRRTITIITTTQAPRRHPIAALLVKIAVGLAVLRTRVQVIVVGVLVATAEAARAVVEEDAAVEGIEPPLASYINACPYDL